MFRPRTILPSVAAALATLALGVAPAGAATWASNAWVGAGSVTYGGWYSLGYVYCHELASVARKIGAGSVDYGGFVYDWTDATHHYGSAPWARPACANPHSVGYTFNGNVQPASGARAATTEPLSGLTTAAHDEPTAVEQRAAARVRAIVGARAGRADAGATLDWPRAHAVAMEGGRGAAWVVPAGDRVCSLVPDGSGGYGAGCRSQAELEAGHAATVLVDPRRDPGHATVAVVVADGAPAPTVVSADGSVRALAVTANLAAVRAQAGDVVRSGPERVVIDDYLAAAARAR